MRDAEQRTLRRNERAHLDPARGDFPREGREDSLEVLRLFHLLEVSLGGASRGFSLVIFLIGHHFFQG